MADQLTRGMIEDRVARAEKVVRLPGDDRCLGFTHALEEAGQTFTAKERCKSGWLVADAGSTAWDAWLDLRTGEGRLRRQVD